MASASPPETAPGTVPVANMTPGGMSDAPVGKPTAIRRHSGRQATRVMYDALTHIPPRQPDARIARRYRQPFLSTPNEREINRVSRQGRPLSELEILQDKHEPEFWQIVPIVADCLASCIEQHAELVKSTPRDPRYAQYETNTVPGIQIEDYVHRLAEYTYISPATLVASLIFLDRLCVRHSSLLVTHLNVFKLFFVAVRVASKVVDLRTLNNKNFAAVGGISNRHLNDLEAKFLIDMRFDLYIQPREFFLYSQRFMNQLATQTPSVQRPMKSVETHLQQQGDYRRGSLASSQGRRDDADGR
jgi:hypothetical protein